MAKVVVVTGSTRGIGLGLAQAFAARDCRVVVNGRSQAAVDAALAKLGSGAPSGAHAGCAGDVASRADVARLWETAAALTGRVDIWINNAGLITPRRPFHELDFEQVCKVVHVNLTGTMACCHVAIAGMLHQGGGYLYNFEGFGSDGMIRPGLTTYGTTKRALRHFTRSLEREYQDSVVRIGTISPGIVATDMLETETAELTPAQRAKARRIYNILGDRVETVAPWLADQVLANSRHGARISWLTPWKAFKRFATSRFTTRHVFEGSTS
jgi:NAD(P)-dependent dehydrogenase (short-subunit alcohol dehydrogenase family)